MTNDLLFNIRNGTTTIAQVVAPNVLQLNAWQHVAVTMTSGGALTQDGACKQPGITCAPDTKNTPDMGWSQVWAALNSDQATQQNPYWVTDVLHAKSYNFPHP